ncbi:hypothetical protein IRJ41_018699, partial [Triplophysa rosa]
MRASDGGDEKKKNLGRTDRRTERVKQLLSALFVRLRVPVQAGTVGQERGGTLTPEICP